MAVKKKKPLSKKRKGAGRPSRESLGLEPTVTVTLSVEQTVIDLAREKYGTLGNALRASVA